MVKRDTRQFLFQVGILAVAYVLLGNARSIQENPFIPGAKIALQMIVPVLAGILFGKWQGALVGFLGTAITALTPAGSVFEAASILPHTIMGFIAGSLKSKIPSPCIALTLVLGHILNLFMYVLCGMIQPRLLVHGGFLKGLAYETAVGVIAVIIISGLYRVAFSQKWR